uniref:NudC domain containing 3 n=1 Tax=Pavo cristatus TaxID=9049 RepID=A0A8C9FJ08_PAVCR
MEALTEMYDQALLGILQHVGNVDDFLRVLFGFLYRKTDFYRLLLRPGDRLGFPPGAAQAMALQAFKVFERMARQDDEKRHRELEAKLRKKEEEEEAAASAERVRVAPAAHEVEVETTEEPEPSLDAGGAEGPQDSPTAPAAASPVPAEPPGAAAPAQPSPAELPTRQEQFQTNPDSYNGAVRENYAWSQDYSDLEIKVPVPKHIVKGKQVSVDISSSAIRVAVLEGSSQRVLMEGKLTHKINTESSLWSLEPGKCVLSSRRCWAAPSVHSSGGTRPFGGSAAGRALYERRACAEHGVVQVCCAPWPVWLQLCSGREHLPAGHVSCLLGTQQPPRGGGTTKPCSRCAGAGLAACELPLHSSHCQSWPSPQHVSPRVLRHVCGSCGTQTEAEAHRLWLWSCLLCPAAPAVIPALSPRCHACSLVRGEMKIDSQEPFLEVPAGCCVQHVWGLFSLLRIFPPVPSLSLLLSNICYPRSGFCCPALP